MPLSPDDGGICRHRYLAGFTSNQTACYIATTEPGGPFVRQRRQLLEFYEGPSQRPCSDPVHPPRCRAVIAVVDYEPVREILADDVIDLPFANDNLPDWLTVAVASNGFYWVHQAYAKGKTVALADKVLHSVFKAMERHALLGSIPGQEHTSPISAEADEYFNLTGQQPANGSISTAGPARVGGEASVLF